MNYEQGSEEWLAWRRSGIGSSNAACLMGFYDYNTPYKLWLDKLGLSSSKETTSAMQRGHDLEPIARESFEKATGIKMTPTIKLHNSITYMNASMDGMSDCGKYAIEIKCPKREFHEMALSGQVPAIYFPQLQHQIEVCGLGKIFYFSFDGKNGIVLEIDRDDDYIKRMIVIQKEFWDCVLNFEPPALTDKDYTQRDDIEWTSAARNYQDIQQQMKYLKEKKETARKNLIQLSGNCSSQGVGLKLSRIVRKGNVNYSDIPELKIVDLEKYRKPPIETWRIN